MHLYGRTDVIELNRRGLSLVQFANCNLQFADVYFISVTDEEWMKCLLLLI